MGGSYDAIVVGLGAAGSATAYQLAKRGRRVLGLDQFGPGHDRGSSHGYHRMIRKSSVQDDGYVPLGERAFALWDELAAESGRELLRMTGEVRLVDTRRNPRFAAVAEAMRRRGFWEILDEAALRALPRPPRRGPARHPRGDGRIPAGGRGRHRAPRPGRAARGDDPPRGGGRRLGDRRHRRQGHDRAG